jgi:hypothetical protein
MGPLQAIKQEWSQRRLKYAVSQAPGNDVLSWFQKDDAFGCRKLEQLTSCEIAASLDPREQDCAWFAAP